MDACARRAGACRGHSDADCSDGAAAGSIRSAGASPASTGVRAAAATGIR
jgi:hypothetical protein